MVLFVFQFYSICNFGEKNSILDLALSGVKGKGRKTNESLSPETLKADETWQSKDYMEVNS